MKKLYLLILLVSSVTMSQTGIRFPKEEHFIGKFHGHYHFNETNANEPGLNYVVQIGYTGKVYALVGFESFSALKGGTIDNELLNGYYDFHGAIGFNLCHGLYEQYKYNAGIRLAKVYRGDIWRPMFGIEAGFTYELSERFGIGLRGTYDKRTDQEIFDWPVEWKFSSFITLTYKFKKL